MILIRYVLNQNNLNIVIGIPAYNEEKNIGSIILKLKKITDKIIVCDDGSTDLTNDISKEMGATVINHNQNLGYGAAIKSLFLKAKEIDADIFVTFDGDGQHTENDIEKILEPIKQNKADIVIGSRFLSKNTDIPKYRKVGIKAITSLANSSIKTKLTDSQSGFRSYNKKALEVINPSEQGMSVSTEILIKADKEGLKISEVPIKISYEGQTSTHNPVSHGASVIAGTLKFVSVEHPLKFYGIPGLALLSIGLFFGIWTLQLFDETRQIITNIALIGIGTTIIGTMLILTSLILFSMTIIVKQK